MNRRIITAQMQAGTMGTAAAGAAAAGTDQYVDKLFKYIPADVTAGWIAVTGLLSQLSNPSSALLWVLFVIFVAFAALWTWRQTRLAGAPPAIVQIIIATIAFIVWVFALGGPFATLPWWNSVYGAILLIVYTLAVPLINP
jgi:hypothetical protein